MQFLPPNYEAPKTEGNYFRFKKGTNTFRILSPAIFGYEYFNTSNKPVRSEEPWDERPEDMKEGGTVKYFMACVVYNYEAKKVQILEITQKTVREAIEGLAMNKKWGDPSKYDIVVEAKGDGLEREYSVLPEPHSEAPKAEYSQINLQALFKGEDPFNSKPEVSPSDFSEELDPKNIPF
jgi:hypothetical protein